MRTATRTRSAPSGALIGMLALTIALTLALTGPAAAQTTTAPPTTAAGAGQEFGDVDPPELVAIGHGIGLAQCFVEVHVSPAWPPPVQIERWVLQIVAQDSEGQTTIRSFASRDLDTEDTLGSRDQRRIRVEVIDVADDVVAFKWGCGLAPSTVEVRFEVNDREGRTQLIDVVEQHPFVDGVRGPGEVPEAELVQDETGDLLSPLEGGGGETPPPPGLGSGTGTKGGLMIVGLVLAMGVFGYFVWLRPSDSDNF